MGSSHVSQAGATLGLEDLLAEMNNASSEADVSAALDALPPMEVSDPLGQLMQPQDNDATLPDLGTVVTPEQVAAEAGKGKGKKASKPKTEKPVAVKAAKPTTKKATTPSKKKKAPEVDAQPETVAADSAPAVTPEVTPEAPKPTPKPRVFFGRNKIGRLEHKFGSNLGKFLVLKVSDAELEGDAFDAKVAETKAMIKALGTKVQTRATNLSSRSRCAPSARWASSSPATRATCMCA
jgi:outer membrane biosynthesis protein TonB